MNLHFAYEVLDLVGTFVFAISGAVAARQRKLDLFGVLSLAFVAACGGGIVRDLCIGATPPAALSDWRYLAASMCASAVTLAAYTKVRRLRFPVLLFDAVGLGLFAVAGAQKSLMFGHSAEVSILLGTVTGVGGGALRDVLLSRVPSILEREIYASAALLGAVVFVLATKAGVTSVWMPWLATVLCIVVRLLALHFGWRVPLYQGIRVKEQKESA